MMRALGISLLILSAAAGAEQQKLSAADVAKEVSDRLNEGKTAESEAIARRLLAQEEAAQRLESEETQRALDLLLEIFCYRADRSTPEIDEVGRRAVALREKLQGPDSFATAQTLRLWAVAQLGRGNYSASRAMVDRAVKIFEKAEQSGHQFSRVDTSQYSRALSDMAGILAFMMDWHASKRVQLKSMSLKGQISTTSPGFGVSYLNLGRLEHYLGNHAEALVHYRKAREILTAAVRADNPLLPELMSAEGHCLYETGDTVEGLAMVERALKAEESIYAKDDIHISPSLYGLAEMYRTEGRIAEAKQLIERAAIISRKAYGWFHPDVAEIAGALRASGAR